MEDTHPNIEILKNYPSNCVRARPEVCVVTVCKRDCKGRLNTYEREIDRDIELIFLGNDSENEKEIVGCTECLIRVGAPRNSLFTL